MGDGVGGTTQPWPPSTSTQLNPGSQPASSVQAGTHTAWQRPLWQSPPAVQSAPSTANTGATATAQIESLPHE